jgi:hypothetical protein
VVLDGPTDNDSANADFRQSLADNGIDINEVADRSAVLALSGGPVVLVEFVDGMHWVDPSSTGSVIDSYLDTPGVGEARSDHFVIVQTFNEAQQQLLGVPSNPTIITAPVPSAPPPQGGGTTQPTPTPNPTAAPPPAPALNTACASLLNPFNQAKQALAQADQHSKVGQDTADQAQTLAELNKADDIILAANTEWYKAKAAENAALDALVKAGCPWPGL